MKDLKTLNQMLHHLVYILDTQQKRDAIIVFLFIIIGACFETLGVSIVLPFVNMLVNPDIMMKNSYVRKISSILGMYNAADVTLLCAGAIIGVYILKNLVIILSGYIQVQYRNRLAMQLQYKMMESYMHRPYEFFVNHDSSYVLRSVGVDISGVQSVIEQLLKLCSELLCIIFIGAYVFYTDWLMSLSVLLIAFSCLLAVVLFVKKSISRLGALNRTAAGEGSKITIEIVQGIKDIFVRQKREIFLSKYKTVCNKMRKAQTGYQFITLLPERIIETFCISGIIIVAIIRFHIGIDNDIFIPKLAVFAVAAFRIMPSVSRITGYINSMIYSRLAVESIYENIKQTQLVPNLPEESGSCDNNASNALDTFRNVIQVQHISWKYENSTTNVLCDLSLSIHRGESVGIIGESGSGKSTLSDILLGLYQPQSGEIFIDGHNLFDIPKAWSKIMGYVPQSVFLLDDTIRANVAFGEENIDDKAVWDALEQSSMKKYVEQLPDALNTIVGDRGILLSGGQRQRIAIARALYSKPDILILDEATSALDNETEAAVMEAIEHLHGTMTTIIIAHRLTTICNCDYIYEIRNKIAYPVSKETIMNKILTEKSNQKEEEK